MDSGHSGQGVSWPVGLVAVGLVDSGSSGQWVDIASDRNCRELSLVRFGWIWQARKDVAIRYIN